ncbi:hypothetical protein I6E18_06435 [Phocaeicola barnesiae]|uniref:Uncharacterized protein n=1 Tax=Phocaeicola barnesiae TaxID=376804 RepID=A0AAW5N9C1_9BACT|nr:hypothetical protein [Phocaeicola barnesiae]MBS6467911.1 hypothetical protein [Bacteroides sp.]MCF2575815.1 hypothetical protein [Phocaeicola barnesiae]MCF2597592.1 hypothetical protein [Phocaeicola barnesiae]MCR8873990.1 hypothetical protein [Phocaeicola barnesiae]MDM8232282.1 hypothetical protein [Phocaeicola barnesiae]
MAGVSFLCIYRYSYGPTLQCTPTGYPKDDRQVQSESSFRLAQKTKYPYKIKVSAEVSPNRYA